MRSWGGVSCLVAEGQGSALAPELLQLLVVALEVEEPVEGARHAVEPRAAEAEVQPAPFEMPAEQQLGGVGGRPHFDLRDPLLRRQLYDLQPVDEIEVEIARLGIAHPHLVRDDALGPDVEQMERDELVGLPEQHQPGSLPLPVQEGLDVVRPDPVEFAVGDAGLAERCLVEPDQLGLEAGRRTAKLHPDLRERFELVAEIGAVLALEALQVVVEAGGRHLQADDGHARHLGEAGRFERRVERRQLQLLKLGMVVDYEEILHNLYERDYIDSTRSDSPLMKAPDAIVIDNSNLTPEEQLAIGVLLAQSRMKTI